MRQCPRIDAFVCTCSLTRVAQFAKRFKLLERPYSPINIDARAICQASKNNDAPASVLLVPACLPPPLSHPWHYCLRRLLLPRSTRTFHESTRANYRDITAHGSCTTQTDRGPATTAAHRNRANTRCVTSQTSFRNFKSTCIFQQLLPRFQLYRQSQRTCPSFSLPLPTMTQTCWVGFARWTAGTDQMHFIRLLPVSQTHLRNLRRRRGWPNRRGRRPWRRRGLWSSFSPFRFFLYLSVSVLSALPLGLALSLLCGSVGRWVATFQVE